VRFSSNQMGSARKLYGGVATASLGGPARACPTRSPDEARRILATERGRGERSPSPSRHDRCVVAPPRARARRDVSAEGAGRVACAWLGYSFCRLDCGLSSQLMGTRDLTDGEWVWPEGFAHYVEHHSVRPPADVADLALGRAMDRPSRSTLVPEPERVPSRALGERFREDVAETRVLPVRRRTAGLHRQRVRDDGGGPPSRDDRATLRARSHEHEAARARTFGDDPAEARSADEGTSPRLLDLTRAAPVQSARGCGSIRRKQSSTTSTAVSSRTCSANCFSHPWRLGAIAEHER
jgi:hypothetical protein